MDSLNLPDLPPDVVLYDILTRTSPETVARSRTVCKNWNKSTHQSSFAQLFNERSLKFSGFFVQIMRQHSYSSKFVSINNSSNEGDSKLSLDLLPAKNNVSIVASAAKPGLLLCLNPGPVKHRVPEYKICKPATQEWQKLPNPKTRYRTLKISMAVLGSNPLRYKIVRFSEPKCPCGDTRFAPCSSFRCEIFCSTTWAWKSLKNIILPFGEFLDPVTPAVSASGFLYSITTERRVFAFDWEKKSWEVFGLPQPLCERNNFRLVEYENRLGLICMVEEKHCLMELWAMEDCRKKTWSLKKNVVVDTNLLGHHFSPVALCNADVVLLKANYNDIIFYNFEKNEYFKVRNALYSSGYEEFFRIESA